MSSGPATAVYWIFPNEGGAGFLFPVIVFFAVASICNIAGAPGNDRDAANTRGTLKSVQKNISGIPDQ